MRKFNLFLLILLLATGAHAQNLIGNWMLAKECYSKLGFDKDWGISLVFNANGSYFYKMNIVVSNVLDDGNAFELEFEIKIPGSYEVADNIISMNTFADRISVQSTPHVVAPTPALASKIKAKVASRISGMIQPTLDTVKKDFAINYRMESFSIVGNSLKIGNDETYNRGEYVKSKALVQKKWIAEDMKNSLVPDGYTGNMIMELNSNNTYTIALKVKGLVEDTSVKRIACVEFISTGTYQAYNSFIDFKQSQTKCNLDFEFPDMEESKAATAKKMLEKAIAPSKQQFLNIFTPKFSDFLKVGTYQVDSDNLRFKNISFSRYEKTLARKIMEKGRKFEDKKLYDKAMEIYLDCALQGNTDAMYRIGDLYYFGNGVEQDYSQAFEWFKKSAVENYLAMYSIGYMYRYGQGVSQDYAQAKTWLQKASENSVGAMKELGDLYYYGYGVPQNYLSAIEWYEKAANNGDEASMTQLGDIYFFGKGITKDVGKAKEWYQKAAAKNNAYAMCRLGDFYYYAQDYNKAFDMYKQASEDIPQAMYMLGNMYFNGQGIGQNYSLAKIWLQKAVDNEVKDAYFPLGLLYFYYSNNSEEDYKKAFQLIKMEAETNTSAMDIMGDMYYYGYGVAQSYSQALMWYEKAAVDQVSAMHSIGQIYSNREDDAYDKEKAIEWYEKAAKHNYLPSIFSLASLYYDEGNCDRLGASKVISCLAQIENHEAVTNEDLARVNNLYAYMCAQGKCGKPSTTSAVWYINKAIELAPDEKKGFYYDSKGEIFLIGKKTKLAVEVWQEMKEKYPEWIERLSKQDGNVFVKTMLQKYGNT